VVWRREEIFGRVRGIIYHSYGLEGVNKEMVTIGTLHDNKDVRTS